jgi:hypothetical protein
MDALWMASSSSVEEKQGDRLCKCSTTGRAIAHQKKGSFDRAVHSIKSRIIGFSWAMMTILTHATYYQV